MFNLKNPIIYWGLTFIIIVIEVIPFVSFTKYTGEIRRGKLEGFGTRSYFLFDEHCEGEFRNGELNGKGKSWFGPKSKSPSENYVGDFQNDFKHGYGTLTLSDGQIYEGDFFEDKFHGKGETRFPNGDTYEGNFKNNLQHGFGVYIFADGRIESGQYGNGEFLGSKLTARFGGSHFLIF